MKAEKQIFTLDQVRKILPKIKAVTEHYHDSVEEMRHQLIGLAEDPTESRQAEIAQAAENEVQKWAREIASTGAEPKGLWLVDFDSGDGFYFCWQFGEEEVEFIHGYTGGYSERRRIDWN